VSHVSDLDTTTTAGPTYYDRYVSEEESGWMEVDNRTDSVVESTTYNTVVDQKHSEYYE